MFVAILQYAIKKRGQVRRVGIYMKRPRKVQKLRDQRAQPVDFRRDVSSQLARKFIPSLQFLGQYFSRAFDHAERIANLMRQAGR